MAMNWNKLGGDVVIGALIVLGATFLAPFLTGIPLIGSSVMLLPAFAGGLFFAGWNYFVK
jgi:hypothetical protein